MAGRGLYPVDLNPEDEISVVTLERLERRLGEETSKLRLDIAGVRTEIIQRSLSEMKWLLAFFVAQTAALAGLMSLFR